MLLLFHTLLLLCLAWVGSADFKLSLPSKGQSYSVSNGKASVKVAWTDDGDTPSLDKLNSVTFVLCTGPSSSIVAFLTIKKGLTAADLEGGGTSGGDKKSITLDIDASAGASGVYFIQVYAVYGTGNTIHYTNRFALKGMTGSKKPSGSLSDASPLPIKDPAGNNAVTAAAALTLPLDHSKSYTVPYTLQTGLIRYAPMQMQPGTTITAKSWKRQYPTSAVTYYSAYRTSLDCLSTNTPGWSYTRESALNYASPALDPAYVGSWYPATKKVVQPTLMPFSQYGHFH